MPVDWLTPLFVCCAAPLLLVGLIAFGIWFARGTSNAGQQRIARRSEQLYEQAREKALADKRRGFPVDDSQSSD